MQYTPTLYPAAARIQHGHAASTTHEESARRRLVQLFLVTKYRFFRGALVIGTTPECGRQDDATALMAANASGERLDDGLGLC
jgi:hypothetical protein